MRSYRSFMETVMGSVTVPVRTGTVVGREEFRRVYEVSNQFNCGLKKKIGKSSDGIEELGPRRAAALFNSFPEMGYIVSRNVRVKQMHIAVHPLMYYYHTHEGEKKFVTFGGERPSK